MLLRSPGSRLSANRALAVLILLTFAVQAVGALPVGAASPPSLPSPLTQSFKPSGEAPADMPVLATLALPLRNVEALDSLVMQVSDPTSPMYRHFLTPQQVESEFLPVQSYDSLISRLNGTGLKVVLTALDSEVVVQGTAGQFRSAFGSGIGTFTNGTYTYYASAGAPTFDGAYVYASNATLLFTKPAIVTGASPDSNVTFTEGTFAPQQLPPVYNATYYYSHGETGTGETIGLLDFYGSPTIASDLAQFDSTFGFPAATLNIIPVGPYDPGLGAAVGWSTEISLDVEASHAMAPGATIDLYVANGALPLSVPLAQIVQDDKVTTLSQSFGNYEWLYSITSLLGGPSYMALNALIPDQYYALGSVEGITFTASAGDGGGSGYSSGPEGSLEYPATSPYVTSVGGTQTYFSALPNGTLDYEQTAWSNIGYVPNLVNAGGGSGGVSILEPKPWYQSEVATPAGYPDGRLNPDLSLQAGTDPAIEIVDGGQVVGIGGTSESSPLLAGLLTLVAQSTKGDLGLINPFIYSVGGNSAEYRRGFTPITFGYTIPWTASSGYNLATGWGAPNMGELGLLLNSTTAQPQLSILGEVVNATGGGQVEYTPGESLSVNARITRAGALVSSGSFTLSLATLQGTFSPVPMAYDPLTGNWSGTIVMGNESGLAYVYVSGASSGGTPGHAIGTIFAGYLGSLTVNGNAYSLSYDPWTWSKGSPLNLSVTTTDLSGDPEPSGKVQMEVEQYSLSGNRYSTTGSLTLVDAGSGFAVGSLTSPAPPGPLSLVLQGSTYGYAPVVFGIFLQTSYIYPEVAAEPGSVAPGQSLTIITTPVAPVNVYFELPAEGPSGYVFEYDIAYGSNVSATLVSPTGRNVSTAMLAYQPCAQALRVCDGGASMIYGQLKVPTDAAPGLYTVALHASYTSLTPGGNLTGSFYGQVWVSGAMIQPSITVAPGFEHASPDYTVGQTSAQGGQLFQGEPAHVVAKLDYADGAPVTFGEYTALLYPASLAGQYTSLMHEEYAGGELVQLSYDPGLKAWVGNVTLPGPANQGGLSGLGLSALEFAGPYDVYVTGLSADGTPTTSAIGAEHPFYIQPYAYTTGVVKALPTSPQVVFDGATIEATGTLSGDLFINSTVSNSDVRIADSQIQGALSVSSSNLTLTGVTGGDINATLSRVSLLDSSVDSLSVDRTNLTLTDSSYSTISPALPVVTITAPSQALGAKGTLTAQVVGEDLVQQMLSVSLDGNQVPSSQLVVNATPEGLNLTVDVDPALMSDGTHTLVVTAVQSDSLSASASANFITDAQRLALQSQQATLADVVYVLAAVAAVALIAGVAALLRGRRPPQNAPPAPPQV